MRRLPLFRTTRSNLEVGSIAFAPTNPNIAYAGMGSHLLGHGVLKSVDA
jgi:hypothetical protein